jgi:hypothetical protein
VVVAAVVVAAGRGVCWGCAGRVLLCYARGGDPQRAAWVWMQAGPRKVHTRRGKCTERGAGGTSYTRFAGPNGDACKGVHARGCMHSRHLQGTEIVGGGCHGRPAVSHGSHQDATSQPCSRGALTLVVASTAAPASSSSATTSVLPCAAASCRGVSLPHPSCTIQRPQLGGIAT